MSPCCRNGALPAAAESCKKGTLKLDLQSLTVGVAVVSMSHWLLKARSALLHDNASSLDAARKLAVVNGLGEHSRAQVLSFAFSFPCQSVSASGTNFQYTSVVLTGQPDVRVGIAEAQTCKSAVLIKTDYIPPAGAFGSGQGGCGSKPPGLQGPFQADARSFPLWPP